MSKMMLGEAAGRISLDISDLVAKREGDQQMDNVHRAFVGLGGSLVPPGPDEKPHSTREELQQVMDELEKAGFGPDLDELEELAEAFRNMSEDEG